MMINFMIIKKAHNGKKKTDQYVGPDVLSYTRSVTVMRKFELEPGKNYRILADTIDSGIEADFLLRIYSKQSLELK